MNTKNIILQELEELNSTLTAAQNPYAVPAGYFDGLLAQVMRRIKALEATNATAETSHLSSLLSGVSKQMPNSVPAGYFETLDQRIAVIVGGKNELSATEELASISPLLSSLSKQMPNTIPAGYFESLEKNSSLVAAGNNELNPEQELESISPLLSSLKKTTPYSVPDGYFDQLTNAPAEVSRPAAKVVSLSSRKWFRVAAAAIVAGVVVTIGLIFINRDKVTADKDSYAWVKKNIKKVSTEKLEEFVQLADVEKSVASVDSKIKQEVKDLVKDIPATEIQSLLKDTEILNDANEEVSDEDVLMN